MDPEKWFELIRKSQRQERQSTSHCRSLLWWKMSFLGFCQEKFLKKQSNMDLLLTMSSSIQRKYTTLSFCHLCNLLGKTGETETWVSCTMMANHNSPIIEFWCSVIDTTIQIPQGNRNLQSFFKITRCRNRRKIRVGNSLGFWTQITTRPFNFVWTLVQAPIKIMTCIAGGPMPLPGKSPIVSFISSSSSSSCAIGRDGGSLANLALIAERWRSDIREFDVDNVDSALFRDCCGGVTETVTLSKHSLQILPVHGDATQTGAIGAIHFAITYVMNPWTSNPLSYSH